MLAGMSRDFNAAYGKSGRPSTPPERLIKALLLQALYSIRSDIQLCEPIGYNLLFRWFLDMQPSEPVAIGAIAAVADVIHHRRSGRCRPQTGGQARLRNQKPHDTVSIDDQKREPAAPPQLLSDLLVRCQGWHAPE